MPSASHAWQIDRQRDFTGGENRQLLPEFIKPNQLVLAQNCVITPEGFPQTRLGKTKVNVDSLGEGGILSLFVYPKMNGSNYLVAQHGTTLYASLYDGSTQIDGFPITAKEAMTASLPLRGVVWKDVLILSNGTDAPFYFNGSACTDLSGTPPKFKIMAVHASRLFVVDAENPNFIRFCGLENYNSWDALDVINVRDNDGDEITAIVSMPGGLLIFKTRSTWCLYGTNKDNMRLEMVSDSVGCVSHDGAQASGVMTGADNWYLFNTSELTPIDETHVPLLSLLTPAQKAQIKSVTLRMTRQVLFSLPNGTMVVLDGKRNCITTWTGLNVGALAACEAEGMDGALLVGDKTNGRVYRLDNTMDDDGTPIETLIKTAYRDGGSSQDKIWRYFLPRLTILSEGGNYEIFLRHDVDYREVYGQKAVAGNLPNFIEWGVDFWGTAVWGSSSSMDAPYWLHGARGNVISFEIKTGSRILFKGYDAKVRIAGGF